MSQIYTCDICDQVTGDPANTDLGLVCEDCMKNDPALNDSKVPTLNEVITEALI